MGAVCVIAYSMMTEMVTEREYGMKEVKCETVMQALT